MTPFQAPYGKDPQVSMKYNPDPNDTPSVQEKLLLRNEILLQLKFNLEKAQQFMKGQADKKRRNVNLEVGDLVLVKLQPYRQQLTTLRMNQKLGMRYFGLFPILAKVGAIS